MSENGASGRVAACPFCGDVFNRVQEYVEAGVSEYRVKCYCCGAKGPVGSSSRDAEMAWRLRMPAREVGEVVER